MVEATLTDRDVVSGSWTWSQGAKELVLRSSAAALHILATWAVLANLNSQAAGTYYKGVVIALTAGTLLYKKYEFYLVPYIIGDFAQGTGFTASRVVTVLRKCLLTRSSMVCALLLVATADLDIFEPRLQPYLETFLPFVIAIPFVAMAALAVAVLRAADRPALSMVATASANAVILAATLLGASRISLELYSWAYLVGALISAGLATWLVNQILPRAGLSAPSAERAAWSGIHHAVAASAGSSVAHSIVLWGPACLLAIFASAPEFAGFAAAVRSAQVLEILLPGLTFLGRVKISMVPWMHWKCTDRQAFLAILGASVVASSVIVGVLLLAGPTLLGFYGKAYTQQVWLFVILLGGQWMNGLGRPAGRFLAQNWQPARVRRILEVAAIGSMVVCGLGLPAYGAFAAAAALSVGWTLMNGMATADVLGRLGKPRPPRQGLDPKADRIVDQACGLADA